MIYNSKKTIANTIAGVLLAIGYIIYALGNSAPASDDLKGWAVAMLIFVGIGVAAIIVIMILFHIGYAIGVAVKEEVRSGNKKGGKEVERIINSSMVEDERDKLIERKSDRVEHIFAGVGFIGMLIALACGASAVTALHIMLGATSGGMLVGGCVNIFYHERGV
jgi:hypothetical protein